MLPIKGCGKSLRKEIKMRIPDAKHILNVVYGIVGRQWIDAHAGGTDRSCLGNFWDTFFYVSERASLHLRKMNITTLTEIGLFTNHLIPVGNHPIHRRQTLRVIPCPGDGAQFCNLFRNSAMVSRATPCAISSKFPIRCFKNSTLLSSSSFSCSSSVR